MPFASYGKPRGPLARKVLGLALAGLIIVQTRGGLQPEISTQASAPAAKSPRISRRL
jgi:hypothetical protein